MKEHMKKFMDLVTADEELRARLEEAGNNYAGEQTEEAAFENIIAPIAQDIGLSITFDDFRQSIQELDLDEMAQVAGGVNTRRKKTQSQPTSTEPAPDGSGFGGGTCQVIGVGALGAFTSQGGVICLLIGGGWGGKSICFEEGYSD